MIERIEITSEALPLNGIDSGFRNMHDRDFQQACLNAVAEVLGQVFGIHSPAMGPLSAKIEYRDDGYAGRVVGLPGGLSQCEREAWGGLVVDLLDPRAFSEMERQGYRYAVVVLVFQGRELIRVGFLLAAPGADVVPFNNLIKTCGIMSSRAVRLAELSYLSRHDALTGLASRTLFLGRIATEIRDLRDGQPGAYLFEVRLACLAEVNDNFGLHAGDELILEAARRLSTLRGDQAFVARVGGSKFMLLARQSGSENRASLMRKVEKALEAPVNIEGQDIRLTVDIGCVALDDSGMHPLEMMQRAETALADARSRSFVQRQKAYIYSDEFFEAMKGNSRLNLMVRQAYSENRFHLVFQPIMDLRKQGVAGCEALLRMRDRHGQSIEASRFMKAVGRIRYQATLDKWVFSEILRFYRGDEVLRTRMNARAFSVAMNCDPGLLSQKGLAKEWLARMSEGGFDPRRFVVEVVENPILFENDFLMINLRTLRGEGVRIAVDDFGSGYSNLRHLADLPADIVKFDRGFLQGVDKGGSRGRELLESMIVLCGQLGFETVCEGVETPAHADFLKSVDCRCAQGYYYGKPMDLSEILALAVKYDAAAEALQQCREGAPKG